MTLLWTVLFGVWLFGVMFLMLGFHSGKIETLEEFKSTIIWCMAVLIHVALWPMIFIYAVVRDVIKKRKSEQKES